MKVGLFFGSFNPIHLGHMAIANYIIEFTEMDQLWFIISPHNPLKKKRTLLADYHRLELVQRAIGNDMNMRASDIEFSMPKPSYTIDTLAWLTDKFPGKEFSLIMGSDQLAHFHKWKNYAEIMNLYHRYVYPRSNVDNDNLPFMENATLVNAPIIEISSSFIRSAIKKGKDVRHFLAREVWEYIDEMNFYRKV